MRAMDELLLLILCSPSGAGKSTLTRFLLEALPEVTFSVSHTTRKPRANEVDGVHYHFVDRDAFTQKVDAGGFAEWAHVHGNLYGTSTSEIDRARREGKRVLVFDIDYQGARQIKAKLPEAVGIFILPPSMLELRRRLEGRATDAPEVIERRYQKALVEIEHYGFFEYLIVNDDLVRAQQALLGITLAERHRRVRLAPVAEQLLRHGTLERP
ncbi:MAG: guanylate kinase [Deltaproteobacteria bacterium]|nr:guanylate kinase [Deltaproteobacteria bacterium]